MNRYQMVLGQPLTYLQIEDGYERSKGNIDVEMDWAEWPVDANSSLRDKVLAFKTLMSNKAEQRNFTWAKLIDTNTMTVVIGSIAYMDEDTFIHRLGFIYPDATGSRSWLYSDAWHKDRASFLERNNLTHYGVMTPQTGTSLYTHCVNKLGEEFNVTEEDLLAKDPTISFRF